jgi:hypothetical protein
MKIRLLIPIAIFLVCTGCNVKKTEMKSIYDNIPSLEKVSGIWVSADTAAMEPTIRNFRGVALANRDLASLSWFVSAPYSGGYHTGVLKINGKTPLVSMFRWQPYQALRKVEADNFEILSSTRMLPDNNAIMWKIDITNSAKEQQKADVSLDMIGFISKYGGDWQWWYPYPKMDGMTTIRDDEVENVRKHIGQRSGKQEVIVTELVNGKPTEKMVPAKWPADEEILNCKKYRTEALGNKIFVYDTETDAVSSFSLVTPPDEISVKRSGGTAKWKAVLKPGETLTIKYLLTYGDDKKELTAKTETLTSAFDENFDKVQRIWEQKWQEIFRPHNQILSGCFPVLETNDTLASKVYYTGPLTMLYLINNNLPQHKKVFLTGGPKWGASITFFWDITEWATLWAAVDPEMMKEHITAWIYIDPSKYYGQDNFGGKGVGNGYSANYWALFQMVRAYITVSGDFGFLDEEINGKTVLQHLEDWAMNWEKISVYGQEGCTDDIYKLADFGDDEWNLLECVPTYKHIVPSFNAGYIWMMRETAAFYEKKGNNQKADSLKHLADEMIQRLLKLYAGDGVWYSLYPDNKKIEVRHCLDFMFMGRYLPKDIPQDIRKDMMDFFYRELITSHWMRAQSLQDLAAASSDRPDHGPLGAYDGWPAGSMDALVQMGFPQKALDFYHAIEPVSYEGCWAQAHELWGENKENRKARVRIAERDWCARDASGGISISQVMLKCFFGFYPDVAGNPIRKPGTFEFKGKLYHVLCKGEYYSITNNNGNIKMLKENMEETE